MITLYQWKNVL